MNRVLVIAALSLAAASFALGQMTGRQAGQGRPTGGTSQSTTAGRQGGTAEQEVAQLERDWAAAMSRADVEALGRMMADELVTVQGDVLWTKQRSLEGIRKRRGRLSQSEGKAVETIDEMEVRVYGDTAVAFGYYSTRTEQGGQTRQGPKVRFLDVAVKRDGRWQFVVMSNMDAGRIRDSTAAPQ